MRKIFLILSVIFIALGIDKMSFSGQPDEDKLIQDLYDKGAMTGYASAPATHPFWYGGGSVYGPYYWLHYNQESASGYNIEVKPAGRILIQVEPLDAEIYVDGRKLQQLPDLSFQAGLFAGTHHVDIIKQGYKKFSEDVTIYPGGGLVIPVKLEKIDAKTKGEKGG